MRILVVNFQDRCHPYAGGAEVHLHEMFGRLVRRGHHVTVLACGWGGSLPREQVDGLDIHRVGSRASFPFLAVRYFHRHLRDAWDVIVDDLNKLPLCVHLWSDMPTVLVTHHLFGRSVFAAAPWPIAAVVWIAERMIGRLYSGIPTVAVSESTAHDLASHGIDQDLISVIPNGTSFPNHSPSVAQRYDAPALLYLGRLQPYKRVDVLLRAMARLSERHVAASLEIVGDGAMWSRLHRLRAELRLEHCVHFHGHVSEKRKQELLAGASMHVTASEKEGWGLSVLEAGAYGLPTIAAYAPGLRDSVLHERTGRFVPVDDPVAFADAAEILLSQPVVRRQLGDGAQCFASLHSWDAAVDALETLLANVATGIVTSRPRVGLVQRHPFSSATLPKRGAGYAPYGAQCATVTVRIHGGNITFTAIIGSTDIAGRWPAIEFQGVPQAIADRLRGPRGVRHLWLPNGFAWGLLAWPEPPLVWLERAIEDCLREGNVDVSWVSAEPATLERPGLV